MATQTIERRSSKSRLSKQDEVEEEEETSPCSDKSDTTIVSDGTREAGVECEGGDDKVPGVTVQSEADSPDLEESASQQGTSPRVKLLVRSEALQDEPLSTDQVNTTKSGKKKIQKDDSLGSDLQTPVLSRDSSVETQYTDSTGIDLEEFIRTTLNKNPKDRMMLYKLESDLTDFIKQDKQNQHKFSAMSSYHRMLVHRVAAFFGLEHNVDSSGKCVIVNTTACTRIPEFRFKDLIEDGGQEDQPRRLILRREGHGSDEGRGYRGYHSLNGKKSKSFEEREEEYHKARERIFRAPDSQEGLLESPVSSKPSSRQPSARNSREDLRWSETRLWSSTDSSGYGTDTPTNRHLVPRANSTGGLPSGRMTSSATQDSMSSGCSSIGSPMSRPPPIPCSPPPADCYSTSVQNCDGLPAFLQQGQVFWVASNLDQVPPGSVLINPQSGQPFYTKDGSIYRHYPSHIHHHQQHHQAPPPPQATPPQQPPVIHTVYQPYSHPQVVIERKTYAQESPAPDLTPQFAALTMQSDSIQEAPSSSQSVQYVVSQPSGYVQQVPYYSGSHQPTNPAQPVRYLYSVPYTPGSTGSDSVPGATTAQYSGQAPYPSSNYQVCYQPQPQENFTSHQPYIQPTYNAPDSANVAPYAANPPQYSGQSPPSYYPVPPASAPSNTHVITYMSQPPPASHTSLRPPSPSQAPPPGHAPYINYSYTSSPVQPQPPSHASHINPYSPTGPQQVSTTPMAGRPTTLPGPHPHSAGLSSNVMVSPRMPFIDTKEAIPKSIVYTLASNTGIAAPSPGPDVRSQPRQRLPNMSSVKSRANKKAWSCSPSSSKDSAGHSPHTSTDSSDSGCHILEVYEFHPSLHAISDAETVLEELTRQGAHLQYYNKDNENVSHCKDNYQLADCLVLAVCDTDVTAQSILANHKSRSYKLRLLSRSYETSTDASS